MRFIKCPSDLRTLLRTILAIGVLLTAAVYSVSPPSRANAAPPRTELTPAKGAASRCAPGASELWGGGCPDLYFLAIAVEDYQDPNIKDLRFPVDDAIALEWLFKAQASQLYGEVHSELLLDEEASQADVKLRMQHFFREAEPTDVLVLALMGHGAIDPLSDRYYFFTWDTLLERAGPGGEPESAIASSGLSQSDILELIRPLGRPPVRLLMLFDTCQSGRLTTNEGYNTRGAIAETPRGLEEVAGDPSQGVDWPSESVARLQIAAAGASELAAEVEGRCVESEPAGIEGHGLLTCSVLRSAFADGVTSDRHPSIVTFNNLQSWIGLDVVRQSQVATQKPIPTGTGDLTLPLLWKPESVEVCDGYDNTLDGYVDLLPSGETVCAQPEVCNGVDDDLDSFIDEGQDADMDGFIGSAWCQEGAPPDCDDGNTEISPGIAEACNYLTDDDCDGLIDEGFDADGNNIADCLERDLSHVRRNTALGVGGGIILGTTAALLGRQAGLMVEAPETYEGPPSLSWMPGFQSGASPSERTTSLLTLNYVALSALGGAALSFRYGFKENHERAVLSHTKASLAKHPSTPSNMTQVGGDNP